MVPLQYLCKKGNTHKEIHEDFIKTLGNESPSYSTVKKWAAEFQRGRESIGYDARSSRPKDAATDINVERSFTTWFRSQPGYV